MTAPRHAEAAVARRTDPVTGCSEIAEFVGLGTDELYAVHHLPQSGSATAVVIVCSPFFAEFPRNYRREVLLGRHLAARGVAVTRFHHRGVGNSTGDAALITLERLVEDARRVSEAAIEHSGAESLAFHGTRLAALTAAASASADKAGLSLWDPAVKGARYFNELLRTRMAQAVHDDEAELSAGALRSQLSEGVPMDVLGHSLHPAFYESLHEAELPALIGEDPRDLLIVQFGRDRKEIARLIETVEGRGGRSDLVTTSETESWWIANRRADYFVAEERRPLTGEVLGATERWLEQIRWLP